MRVVLSQPAHAQHPVQFARLLVAIDRAELGQPHGKVPIAAMLCLVNLHVVRAVHGLEQVAFLLFFPQCGGNLSLPAGENVLGEAQTAPRPSAWRSPPTSFHRLRSRTELRPS